MSVAVPVVPSRLRRLRLVPVVVVLVALLAGCQVQGVVSVKVAENGSGTVQVKVGLDDAALARVGDPKTALRLDDLTQAGWKVTGPKKDESLTWWTAEKGFADPSQLPVVLGEVAGPDVLRDVKLERTETGREVTLVLTGQLDLSKGAASFSDEDVAAALDGDPLGGNVAAIEAAEGRPVADLVTARLDLDVAGVQQSLTPRLGDPPVPIAVTAVKTKPVVPTTWLFGVALLVVVALVAAGLLAARRRFAAGR